MSALHECTLSASACVQAHGWPAYFDRRDERVKMLARDRAAVASLSAEAKPSPNGRALLVSLPRRIAESERMLACVGAR